MQAPQRQRGFTLIELLTVGVIIGIMAAFAGPNLLGWRTAIRVKGYARDIASMTRTAKARALESGQRAMMVVYRGTSGDASDDAVALFTKVPSGNYVVTSLTPAQLQGKNPPPAPLVWAGAVNNSGSTIKQSEVGFAPIGVGGTFPWPYNTVSTANSCSFCSGAWGVLFFETDGTVSTSNGSVTSASRPSYVTMTVSPRGEWSSTLKKYYTIILNTTTGTSSVWNSSGLQ